MRRPISQPETTTIEHSSDEQGHTGISLSLTHFHQAWCRASVIYSVTEHWPVPPHLRDRFDVIKYTHIITPLPVFENDIYVEPTLVNNTLKNSLVEVHFNIRHHKIGTYDSFTGIPIQVIILKSSLTPSPSPYKQKDIREGPFRLKPFNSPTRDIVPIASTFHYSPFLSTHHHPHLFIVIKTKNPCFLRLSTFPGPPLIFLSKIVRGM